jgi:hypothetical protein
LEKKERVQVSFRNAKNVLDGDYKALCASSFRMFIIEYERVGFAQKIPNYYLPRAKREQMSMV